MNNHIIVDVASVRPAHMSERNTPLGGRRLRIAQIGYLALAAIVLVLNIVALPHIWDSQLTPDALRVLRRQGFSPFVYNLIGTATSVGVFLLYLALSLLIFWRRSEERIALFCAYMLVVFGGVAASPLDDTTGGGPMPPPLGTTPALAALVHILVVFGQVAFVMFFYLFPSGRFVPRWTRWLAALALGYWTVNVFIPRLVIGPQSSLILVFWVGAIVAQIYRYRRVSTPKQREQTKWIAFGLASAGLLVFIPSLIQLLLPTTATSIYSGSVIGFLIVSNTWVVAVLLIPVAMTTAILRSRLWDIDVIINRALVYGSLTVALAALYFGCVFAAQAVVRAITGQAKSQQIIIVASTLVVAALFTPLRRRIQSAIDRRFYRRKYDAAKTLSAFSASLQQQVELAALREHLLAVVTETMQPECVLLWLPQPQRSKDNDSQPAHARSTAQGEQR